MPISLKHFRRGAQALFFIVEYFSSVRGRLNTDRQTADVELRSNNNNNNRTRGIDHLGNYSTRSKTACSIHAKVSESHAYL